MPDGSWYHHLLPVQVIFIRVAIYTRVSTETQGLDQQIDACKAYCSMKGWTDVDVYREIQSSAKARPVFAEVLRRTRAGDYQCIVVFRFDRAWRSSRQMIMDFDNLSSTGKYVVSVQEGFDPTTPIGKCMITILVALAELERVQISEATRQRLQALKQNKKHLGRPFGSKDKHKRDTDGYKNRWRKTRGTKQLHHITPEHIKLNKQ